MEFMSLQHHKKYEKLLAQSMGEGVEYRSSIYLLSFLEKDISSYVDDGIYFPKLFEDSKTWTSAEKALVRLAASLFNGNQYQGDIAELPKIFCHLSGDFFEVAHKALQIRYQSPNRNLFIPDPINPRTNRPFKAGDLRVWYIVNPPKGVPCYIYVGDLPEARRVINFEIERQASLPEIIDNAIGLEVLNADDNWDEWMNDEGHDVLQVIAEL